MNFRILTLVLLLGTLCLAATKARAEAPMNGLSSSITIYVYPPRKPIDWSTPKKSLTTFLGNLLRILISKNNEVEFVDEFSEPGTLSSRFKSSMGHTIGHVRCSLPGGDVYDRWTSLSGQDMTSVDKQILIKDKIGLGALFYDYLDGHIIAGAGNIMRLVYYKGDKVGGERIRPRYMQFEVDAEHCAKIKEMVTFFESFHYPKGTTLDDLEKYPSERVLYFTNTMDPYDSYLARKRQGKGKVGGGCAPYAAGLLKISGRYKKELEPLWRTPVSVSEKLIGGIVDRQTGETRKVSLRRLLLTSLGSRWNYQHEGYPSRRLSLYDPQKIWEFTGNMFGCLAKTSWCPASLRAILGAEAGKIRRGAPRIFSNNPGDSLYHEALASRDLEFADIAADASSRELVEQRVDGFVWKLR